MSEADLHEELTGLTMEHVPDDKEWHIVHLVYGTTRATGYVDGKAVAQISDTTSKPHSIELQAKRDFRGLDGFSVADEAHMGSDYAADFPPENKKDPRANGPGARIGEGED